MTDLVQELLDDLKPQGELRPLCRKAAVEINRLRVRVTDLEEQILTALGERRSRPWTAQT